MAWVYFESKNAKWRSGAGRLRNNSPGVSTQQDWLQKRVEQMAALSDSVAPGSSELLHQCLNSVIRDQKKKPDNWLHENMATRHHRSYSLFATSNGNMLPDDTVALNEAIYQVLCRETHVGPRLESFGIIHDRSTGKVHLDKLPRDLQQARTAVIKGTELAVSEGIQALKWQRDHAA